MTYLRAIALVIKESHKNLLGTIGNFNCSFVFQRSALICRTSSIVVKFLTVVDKVCILRWF